ncbi:MAG: pseudouridine synthase, partial [Pseudomonadota bacterium]|nr:pseudouridine synthase [Pseudomonadota bacterium]
MKASSEDQTIKRHITVDQTETTAVDLLATHLTFSKQQIKDAMQKGCVWLTRDQHTQRLRRAKKTLKKDDQLHIYYRRSILQQAPIASRLVADEGLYSVWDKSYGVLSHGSKWGDHQSLGRYAESHLSPQRNAFVVHRLDRAATGLMLIAHSKKAAQALGKLFEARQIDNHYQVAVHGQFPEASQRFTDSLDNKPALTIAKQLDYNA